MKRSRRKNSTELGLDSLVDIVSNSVGILVILAAFMALLAQHSTAQLPPAPTQQRLLKLPWSHPSDKKFALFSLHNNKLHYLDLKPFYLELAQRPSSSQPLKLNIPDNQLNINFFPVTNQIYCLEIIPKNTLGESWEQAQFPDSNWQRANLRHPPAEYIYFFWVTPNSFARFHQVRDQLRSQGVEVGWMPRHQDHPMEFCNGFGGTAAFRPQ